MSLSDVRKSHLFAALMMAFVTAFAAAQWSNAQEKQERKEAAGRLPAYYKDVVDTAQKEKIYAVQAEFNAKIAPLQEQIKKLVIDRDAAVEAVLTAEQKEKLKKLRDDSATKKKAAGLGPAKGAEEKKEAAK